MAERVCTRCTKDIVERSIVIGDKQYHPECFSCSGCKKSISGKFFPTPDGGFICVACGSVPCAECNLPILGPRLETGGVSYHAECFRCAVCKKEIKDKFSKWQGRIECVSCKNTREAEQKAKNDAARAAAAKDRAEREAKEREERERHVFEDAERERLNVEAQAKARMEQIRKEREERDRQRAEKEGRLPRPTPAILATSDDGSSAPAAAAPAAVESKPAAPAATTKEPSSGGLRNSNAGMDMPADKPTDKPADKPAADKPAEPAAPAAGVKRVAIKVGGGKVSISTSALSDDEIAEITKLFAPLLRLASAYEKSSAGVIRKYDDLKNELLKEVSSAISALKALIAAAISLSGKDIIASVKALSAQAEKLVDLYKQYAALSVSPPEAVNALRAAMAKFFGAVSAANTVVTERASSASKEAVNNEQSAAVAASDTAAQALKECTPGVSSESGWPEFISQLKAFAKEVEDQQLEAKEQTGALLASRPSDELIEAIPLVAHLSKQVMKRVADFGEPKFSDEQKAEFALDGLALGEQLSKEAIPKLVKESILVALGTDSVDARNRMLMAAKKIAANLVELAKYASARFASKGAKPTEEEAEEAEIISGGLNASMGILMDTATGLKEGRREVFNRSPSPRHRRTPSGIGLGSGGSSGNLGSSDPTPAPFGHRRTPSYAALQKPALASSAGNARSQSPAVAPADPPPAAEKTLSAAASASPTDATNANVETKKGMTPSQIREEQKRKKEEEAKRIAALRSGRSDEFEKEKKEREEKAKKEKEEKERKEKEAKEEKEKKEKEEKAKKEAAAKQKAADDAERQRLLDEAKKAEIRLSERDEEEEQIRKMEEELRREEEALLAEENRVKEDKAKAEEKEKAEKEAAAKAAADAERKAKEDAELAAQRELEVKKLAEIEEEERRLREEEEKLRREEEETLRLAEEEEKRKAEAAAQAQEAPKSTPAAAASSAKIEDALADSIVARHAFEASPAQHEQINALFVGLEMAAATIESLVAAVKSKGVGFSRLNDEEFGAMPDSVDRPRGPADYFKLTTADGKAFYVVISTGAPYLSYYPIGAKPAEDNSKRELEDAEAKKKAEEGAAAAKKAVEEEAAKRKAEEEAEAKRKADEEAAAKHAADEVAAKKAADEEAARKAAEAEEKRKADEAAAKHAADEAAAKKAADEEAARKKKAEEEEIKQAQEAADAEWKKAEEEEARQVEARATLLQREALVVSTAADSIAVSLKSAGHTAHRVVLEEAIARLKQMHKDIDGLIADYEKELHSHS